MEEQKNPGQMPEGNGAGSGENDVEKNKLVAVVAYLIFFLPLLVAPQSQFGRYHANQGLALFILALGIQVVGWVIPILGWFIILPLGNLAVIVLMIIGMLNAWRGEKRPLPLVGGFEIIK